MSRGFLLTLRAPAALAAGALQRPARAAPAAGWSLNPAPGLLARLRGGALPSSPSWREQAQERLLDGMAERIARLEIALLREQRRTRDQALRADLAESAIIRLQSTLDHLRQEQSDHDSPASLCTETPAHRPATA